MGKLISAQWAFDEVLPSAQLRFFISIEIQVRMKRDTFHTKIRSNRGEIYMPRENRCLCLPGPAYAFLGLHGPVHPF
jgi:hypothetical protein